MIKIKINNKEYEIEYYDLLKFCKELTLELTNEETNRINLKNFKKNIHIFLRILIIYLENKKIQLLIHSI